LVGYKPSLEILNTKDYASISWRASWLRTSAHETDPIAQ